MIEILYITFTTISILLLSVLGEKKDLLKTIFLGVLISTSLTIVSSFIISLQTPPKITTVEKYRDASLEGEAVETSTGEISYLDCPMDTIIGATILETRKEIPGMGGYWWIGRKVDSKIIEVYGKRTLEKNEGDIEVSERSF